MSPEAVFIALLGQADIGRFRAEGRGADVQAVQAGKYAVTYHAGEWPSCLLTPESPWNWQNGSGLALHVRNVGPDSVELGVRMDDDPSADGWNHSRTGVVTVQPGESRDAVMVFSGAGVESGMRGQAPVGTGDNVTIQGAGDFLFNHVVQLQMFLHSPKRDEKVEISGLNMVARQTDALDGIVDRFGQYAKSDWPGKIHSLKDLTDSRQAEAKTIDPEMPPAGRDRFGGDARGPRLTSTGFFRTERRDSAWWFVDPEGNRFISLGMDVLGTHQETFVTGRERMFASIPAADSPLGKFRGHYSNAHMGPIKEGDVFNFYGANLRLKYGEDWQARWQDVSIKRLKSWGFDTVGNWSDPFALRNGRIPYVATASIEGPHARVSSGSDYWGPMHDPFDPQFAKDVETSLSDLTAKVKGDPWCLGYFVDNELSWARDGEDGRYGLAIGALQAAKGSFAKGAFVNQLRRTYSEVAKLDAAWGTSFSSWEEMASPVGVGKKLNDAEKADFRKFVHAFALKYFTTVRDELKRRDPDHLYLGCRFAWFSPECEKAASEVCDVISYNIYAPKIDPQKWGYLASLGKPCIIGEFHFGALDRGMFHPGLVSTPNQAARAAMYTGYVTSVLQNPALVGCHWFEYVDEPLTGRWYDGENYNIGFVSVTDTPYAELVSAARQIHSQAYQIRGQVPK